MDCKFGQHIHRVHPNKSPLKIWEKREHGHIQGLPNFQSTPIILGRGKATDFKFGRNVHRVHPNKNPLKIQEKRERGRMQGLPKFFQYPLLSQEWVKLRTSNFVRTFIGSIGTKAHYKFGKSSRQRTQGFSKILRASIHMARHAVILAVAQLSCYISSDVHETFQAETETRPRQLSEQFLNGTSAHKRPFSALRPKPHPCRSGTDLLSLLILISLANVFNRSVRLCCFKSDPDEI